MGIEFDQTTWRMVFCADPSLMNVTVYPHEDALFTVVQPDSAELKCTNTPDGMIPQMVTQYAGVKGIWPAADSERINKTMLQEGDGQANIYTVAGDKKMYIASCYMTSRETADATGRCWMFVEDASHTLKSTLMVHYYTIAGQQSGPRQFVPAIEADPTDIIVIASSHDNVLARGIIDGWLEDA